MAAWGTRPRGLLSPVGEESDLTVQTLNSTSNFKHREFKPLHDESRLSDVSLPVSISPCPSSSEGCLFPGTPASMTEEEDR